jgi:Type I phosphodiesterase / nucleotide pyrophosphatase
MTDLDQVRPRYGTGSLADLMPSVLAVLGVPGAVDAIGLVPALDGVRRVAVLLVDGLGLHNIPAAVPFAPSLADLAGRPEARQLTAGFPSTTPTSLVSLGTGATPGTHGVLGFRVNVPGTDRVLTHTHWRDEPDPREWQPVPTLFEAARAAGVTVSVSGRPEFAHSGLTVAANRGGDYRPAAEAADLAAQMIAGLTEVSGPSLSYGYFPDLDRNGHIFGVDSPQWRGSARDVDRMLELLVDGLPADGALLVTADHGQLNVPAAHRFDFDADPRLQAGVRVVAGEPRVRYLHTLPGAVDDVVAAWTAVLGEAAWVTTRAEAISAGWFGPVPERHLQRVGDVVAICHDDYAVVAPHSENAIKAMLLAYHGSYTAVEMEIPLLVARGGNVGGSV